MAYLQEGEGGNSFELILFPHADMDKRRFRQLIANLVYRIVFRAAAMPKQRRRGKRARLSHFPGIWCNAVIWHIARASIKSFSSISAIRHK